MQLHRLAVDKWLRPDPPIAHARAQFRGPQTIAEVLARASAEMDAQDGAGVSWPRRRPARPSLLRRLLRR